MDQAIHAMLVLLLGVFSSCSFLSVNGYSFIIGHKKVNVVVPHRISYWFCTCSYI